MMTSLMMIDRRFVSVSKKGAAAPFLLDNLRTCLTDQEPLNKPW